VIEISTSATRNDALVESKNERWERLARVLEKRRPQETGGEAKFDSESGN
jgi:hypothetical protein